MLGEKKFFAATGASFRVYSPDDLSKKWFVEYYVDGKRVKRYGTINRESDHGRRMEKALALLEEIRGKLKRKPGGLEKRVRQYLEEHSPRWRRKTWEQYASISNVFFEWAAGRPVNPTLIGEFLQTVRAQRHPTTYNKYLNSLKRLFEAVGHIGLFDNLRRQKTEKTPAKYFQSFQAKRLASAIREGDPLLWLFIQHIYYCFIRPGELRQLQADDYLLEEKKIRIPGEKSKNRKTQYVVIPDAFLPDLEFIYKMNPEDYVFPSDRLPGKPVGVNMMYNRHEIFLKQLGFGKGYSLYSWKHTGAVTAAKSGASLKELQIQLRHHSLDETDGYLRQMGVQDLVNFGKMMPKI